MLSHIFPTNKSPKNTNQPSLNRNPSCYSFYLTQQKQTLNEGQKAALSREKQLWRKEDLENWTLFYHILANDQKKNNLIRKAFQTWKDTGICLKFVETLIKQDAHIKILYGPKIVDNDSWVGRDNVLKSKENQFTMRLAFDPLENQQRHFQVALHQIGHAIGLEHEHQNPYSQIKWNTAQEKNYIQIQIETRKNVFTPAMKKQEGFSTTVDRSSIMVYQFTDVCFFSPPQLRQYGTKPIGRLTDKDISFVKSIYPDPQQIFTPIKDDKVLQLKAQKSGASVVIYFQNTTTHFFSLKKIQIPKTLQPTTVIQRKPDEQIKWNSTSTFCFQGESRTAGTIQYKCELCGDTITIKWLVQGSKKETVLSLPMINELKKYQKGITVTSQKSNHAFKLTQSKLSFDTHKCIRITCTCPPKAQKPFYNFPIHR